MQHFASNEAALRAVESFLTGRHEPGELPPSTTLEATGLAAYASTVQAGEQLRRALLTASARHAAVKARLRQLLGAWREAGIEALLFKGFQLAEFVYPTPGGRQYSDVDLLIEQRDALEAAEVAGSVGWHEVWHAQRRSTAHARRGARYRGHEVIQLLDPQLGIQLDVHRRLVHNNHNQIGRYARQERITRMVWEDAQVVDWEGISLKLPQPVDAVLVGLVLNRCWSPEDFELRSHDYLDFRFLVAKYEITLAGLRQRAQELGCSRTFELFLERCDPFRRRCVLSKPTRLELQRWNLLIACERGNRYLERGLIAAGELPVELLDVIRGLPGALRTLATVRRRGAVRGAWLESKTPSVTGRELGSEEWKRLRRAVHRALRVVGGPGFWPQRRVDTAARDLEALALLRALHERNYPASLEWKGTPGYERPVLLLSGVPLNVSGTLLAARVRSVRPQQERGGKRQLG
ncbi:MAG TPA: nucleotidyltransferase family protein [Trueperaceae bacterium]